MAVLGLCWLRAGFLCWWVLCDLIRGLIFYGTLCLVYELCRLIVVCTASRSFGLIVVVLYFVVFLGGAKKPYGRISNKQTFFGMLV